MDLSHLLYFLFSAQLAKSDHPLQEAGRNGGDQREAGLLMEMLPGRANSLIRDCV